jgi:hypothetical protein
MDMKDGEKPVQIFCCYAREDQELLIKLHRHLHPLRRQGLVEIWADIDISPGADWQKAITQYLNTAQIVLLLVSKDFIASDYCYSIEMQRALERHEEGTARVIPIILCPVYWEGAPFSKLQVLPTGARPIIGREWHNVDEAFTDVAHGIHKAVEELRSKSSDVHRVAQFGTISGQKEPLLFSHVTLIDASLDPHDSYYEQITENGTSIIRHKGLQIEKGVSGNDHY